MHERIVYAETDLDHLRAHIATMTPEERARSAEAIKANTTIRIQLRAGDGSPGASGASTTA